MTAPEENKRLARRVPEDIATDGNLDLFEEVYAEDAIEHDPSGDYEGRETIRESFEEFLAAIPDFSATVEDSVAEADTVAMRVRLRGTPEGEFMGIESTGETFDVQNMVFTRIDDGMIVERWVQPDTLGLMQQLGVISTEVGPGEEGNQVPSE